MNAYYLPVCGTFQYTMTGKFKAPSPEWLHMERVLSDFELIIMTEGVLHIALDNDTYTLRVGDFLICAPLMRQCGTKSSDCSFYWLHFAVPGLEQPETVHVPAQKKYRHGGDAILLPVAGTLLNADKISVMMRHLQDAVRSYDDNLYNNFCTTSIIIAFANECRIAFQEQGKRNQQIYNDIIDFINWNIYTNIKVADVATHFGYNSKYLSHLFDSLTGQSLKQYIITEKIKHAKFMLTDTNDTVSVIAFRLGFSDSHNFMQLFKKHVGLTPTEYRNAYSKRLLYYV